MPMFNTNEILDTIHMIDQQHLDVRTVTMGVSLRSEERRVGNEFT